MNQSEPMRTILESQQRGLESLIARQLCNVQSAERKGDLQGAMQAELAAYRLTNELHTLRTAA